MLIGTCDMHQPEETILDLITHCVTVNLHMLSSLMENGIRSNVNCRFTITEKLCCNRDLDTKKGE